MGKLITNPLITALAVALTCFSQDKGLADTVYVWSDDTSGTLRSFETNGFSFLYSTGSTLSGWNGATGLALDNAGYLYAGCPGQSTVYRFNSFGFLEQSSYPNDSVSGLAFDFFGKLYETVPNYVELTATDYLNGRYVTGPPWVRWTSSHLNYPICLAFDATNNVYVSNLGGNTVEKFDYDFTYLGAFASGTSGLIGISNPWGIAFDASGNLFIANSGSNRILKVTPSGIKSVFATSASGLNAPHGLAFDSSGKLLVANYGGGNILKFAANGVVSTFASGLTNPVSIACFPGLNTWSATPLKLNPLTKLTNGVPRFSFTASAGLTFSVLMATNFSSLPSAWQTIGSASEPSPGAYEFVDAMATNSSQRFYRIRSQ